MSIKSLNPYLNFDGTAEKAIKHYENALGAKVEGEIMRFAEVPGMEFPPEYRNRVMHAMLKIGGGVVMISDCPPGAPLAHGNRCSVTLHLDDVAETNRLFNALAKDGKVTMALDNTFWGAYFGMLEDAFGIQWMFNCETQKA
jgi:PhnB protein